MKKICSIVFGVVCVALVACGGAEPISTTDAGLVGTWTYDSVTGFPEGMPLAVRLQVRNEIEAEVRDLQVVFDENNHLTNVNGTREIRIEPQACDQGYENCGVIKAIPLRGESVQPPQPFRRTGNILELIINGVTLRLRRAEAGFIPPPGPRDPSGGQGLAPPQARAMHLPAGNRQPQPQMDLASELAKPSQADEMMARLRAEWAGFGMP